MIKRGISGVIVLVAIAVVPGTDSWKDNERT
jgi:hypothetical protein